MSFPYKYILLIGATSGIGQDMAERFVETSVKVTAVGRRQERLDEFVKKYGADKPTVSVSTSLTSNKFLLLQRGKY